MRRHKYNVAPPEQRRFNGRTYASKAECEYARILYMQRDGGAIRDIVDQPRTWLGVPENVYVPDFLVIDADGARFVDVKGVETPAFRKVKRLWKTYGRLDLVIIKRKGKRFVVAETITPDRREEA